MISLPREMGGTMRATENHRGAGAKSVDSVFERGRHWVSDEQGGLNPGSVSWLFKWALAGNSDSNAHRSAGEEAAFDSINLTNDWPNGYRRMKLIGCAGRTGR